MIRPNRQPDSSQQLSQEALNKAKAALESSGSYEGLTIAEKMRLTLQVGRCIELGGVAFQSKNGQLEPIYTAPLEERGNEAG